MSFDYVASMPCVSIEFEFWILSPFYAQQLALLLQPVQITCEREWAKIIPVIINYWLTYNAFKMQIIFDKLY